MTYYLSFRSQMTAGSIKDPRLFTGAPGASALTLVPETDYPRLFRQRNIVFVTHGFNVDGEEGINALGRFDQRLAATGAELCIALLWPGDWWIPVVNYPVEGGDAAECGRRLAGFCKDNMAEAASLSFVSHSLGGRLILEAVQRLGRVGLRAHVLCLTAAAVDDDCLQQQYAGAVANCDEIANLASKADRVLHYAYTVGDSIGDALGDSNKPFTGALGRYGPQRPSSPNVVPREIPQQLGYDHGDYLPPSASIPNPANTKWQDATDFMIRAYRNQRQEWP